MHSRNTRPFALSLCPLFFWQSGSILSLAVFFLSLEAKHSTDEREKESSEREGESLEMVESKREIDDYHYVFSADCKPYMDWQSAALYQSWMDVGAPGKMTRLLSCTDAEYDSYENLNIVPTHKTPDFSRDDPSDSYSAYNLPGSINHWTKSSNFTRLKWVVKLDADMILRRPFTVREIPARVGVVAGGYYGYLSGVKNDMASMFVGPAVRERLAQVGGWEIFARSDIAKAAPLWFEYTRKVRRDKRVWWPYNGTGDSFITQKAPRPWISEMYGYVFGVASAGLSHNVNNDVQMYAGSKPWNEKSANSFVIHYGLMMRQGTSYEWDKHFEYAKSETEKDKLKCGKANRRELFPVCDLYPEDDESIDKYERNRVELMHECVSKINRGILLARKRKCMPKSSSNSSRRSSSSISISSSSSSSNNEGEAEKKKVSHSLSHSSSGSVNTDGDKGYKHARVSIGGGENTLAQQQDVATNELWKYAGILWSLTLFALFYGFWPSRKRGGGGKRRKVGHLRP